MKLFQYYSKIFKGVILKNGVFVKGKCAIVGSDYCRRQRTMEVLPPDANLRWPGLSLLTQKICDKSGKSIFVIPPNTTNIDNLSTTLSSNTTPTLRAKTVLRVAPVVRSKSLYGYSDQSADNEAAYPKSTEDSEIPLWLT